MTEREFMATVVEMARALGWMVYHTHDSRKSQPGFPDLVLVRDRVVYLECKTATGKLSLDQQAWIAAITAAGGTALVVRPADLDRIEQALRRDTRKEKAALQRRATREQAAYKAKSEAQSERIRQTLKRMQAA